LGNGTPYDGGVVALSVTITVLLGSAALAAGHLAARARARIFRRALREAHEDADKRRVRLRELRWLQAIMVGGLPVICYAVWLAGWPRALVAVAVAYVLASAAVLEVAVRRNWRAFRPWER
jgi:hypothetical protein